MFELIAEGSQSRQRMKSHLMPGQVYELGRDAKADLSIPWDRHISRRHVRLTPTAGQVEVEKLPLATNPLFFAGREVEACSIRGGEHFVLGETIFHLVAAPEDEASPGDPSVREVTFDPRELSKVRFRDANQRIEVLSRLPEVIWGARTTSELYHRLVNLILAGVARAEAVAIVELDEAEGVRLLRCDRRRDAAGAFRPSRRLVHDALVKRRQSVLHVWQTHDRARADYTEMAEFDWAFCTPVLQPSSAPWGLYVAGRLDGVGAALPNPEAVSRQLQAEVKFDVKFTELVAEIISTVQRLNKLEQQRSVLRQFFPPPIQSALEELSADRLEPRECDVTVMFCDLRGFSREAEESAGDLIGLLNRVSRALEVMTHHIHKHNGVTGDFQGDAVLGFWGWPFPSDESPLEACRAALGIRKAFAETHGRKDHPLSNFRMGIGIAQGRAVAGKIGTREQVKVTVFGPVVNLASRLESMTKQLRVPILLDETTAETLRRRFDPREGRTRRLAKVLPYGMEKPVVVSELLPPESEYPELTDAHLKQYECGVDHFITGRWEEAYHCLHAMPPSDRAQDFLGMLIAQHNRIAPHEWDGIVRLPGK